MPESLVVSPGDRPGTCKDQRGKVLTIPQGWALLPPGDAGLTRRVKAAGPTWTVQEKKGRRVFSQGVWADARIIEEKKKELEIERSTEAYAKRQLADKTRRDKKQANYVNEFESAVLEFLDFAPLYESIAVKLAKQVTEHATPVGSGTVARTERISVERRAESAVIAWMRHQTTAYDSMKIARIRGERRDVRRQLAQRSRELLDNYRRGNPVSPETCPLQIALRNLP
ncbi:MAG: DUF2293 domain-containing protein [Pirellula sp.]|jgi:hypothetical protein